ncbi:MAG: primary-amine oxidase [Microbacterium ginsengisoli]|uniref:primary-amine oxidase n=1 Tax=Microbacterium TaxID=33882 RepID=UPI0006FC3A4B|nr:MULTISPECIES: primary-amine oxidase [unclassified Microbacterium]KQR94026.1 tyramine oxidase [Microbacterium sp. Leaf347]KQR97119.1 tyramine oxidase [Microbacterium sp. Leaf351]MBN9198330.1 primary-amine oxidase [Microbacterium ginsengisoli]OJU78248.1 MAG: tyramine oxidase [Microbacterium sp. 71-23]
MSHASAPHTHAPHEHAPRAHQPHTATHPRDPLSADEIAAARAVLVEAGLLGSSVRVPMLLPDEPSADDLSRFVSDGTLDRRVDVTLLDTATGAVTEAIVSITRGTVDAVTPIDTASHPYGQPQYLFEDYERAEQIVKASAEWRAAMTRRGLAEHIDLAFCSPLAPGFVGRENEVGRRVIRSLTFLRHSPDDNAWAHPVEGLIVHVDLVTGAVIDIEDVGDIPVPAGDGRYTPDVVGPARTSLKPIEITQPEGPSFTVDGSAVDWEKWRLRVDFNAREGLVLHDISFDGRSVLRRASVPEMVVPYGDTVNTKFWISYFDAGEYLLGKNANALELGCDCLGVIHYFDGVVADDHGHPVRIPQAICMHEEDYGILWKHTEPGPIGSQVRRSRRLVVSYFATIGNYDYGFFWYFYLDGSIQVEAKATGIVFVGAGIPGTANPHAPEIAPGVFAPVHQHLFCARLEPAIDGARNRLVEIDAARVPMGPDNPFGNAFTWTETPLLTEQSAQREADTSVARVWEVRSTSRTNYVGRPTAYHLLPEPTALLLADPASSVAARAAFATKHLWGTAYDRDERWPAGRYPNAHAGGAGLPAYTADDRSIDDAELVLWHTFGLTHVPRPEDWPIMPVDYAGFWFKPYGFSDVNPALDVPEAPRSHGGGACCTGGACTCAH